VAETVQVLAVVEGVKVKVIGIGSPRESYAVVVTVTGLVAPAARFPPRVMFWVSFGLATCPCGIVMPVNGLF
jgi:hypothetical protein